MFFLVSALAPLSGGGGGEVILQPLEAVGWAVVIFTIGVIVGLTIVMSIKNQKQEGRKNAG